jgi:hypothetical protein
LMSTGILPIRLNATGGAHLDLVDGQLGTVGTAGPPGPHGYALTSTLHLDLWWWITVILIWFTPLLAALLTGPPAPAAPQPPGADHPDDEHPTGDHPGPGPESSGRQTLDEPAVPTGHDARRPPRSAAGGSGRAPRRRPWLLLLGAVAAVLIAAALAPSTAAAFTAKISNTADTVGTAPYFTCAAAATAYSPFFSYPLADAATASANTAADVSGNTRTGTYGTNIAPSASNPCSNRDTTGSILLSGTGTTTLVQTPTQVTNPTVFTETIRFKTVTGGGKLIGFGNLATGTSSNYDRHLYLTNTGQVVFGVYNNVVFTAISPATYLDGNWHQATATLSTAGMIRLPGRHPSRHQPQHRRPELHRLLADRIRQPQRLGHHPTHQLLLHRQPGLRRHLHHRPHPHANQKPLRRRQLTVRTQRKPRHKKRPTANSPRNPRKFSRRTPRYSSSPGTLGLVIN